MGGGYWKRDDFARYCARNSRTVRADGHVDTSGMRGAQDMYKAKELDPDLNPYKVTRECCDNEEHPATVPVILALDVTGSMGGACLRTAATVNVIMQDILAKYDDVEFMVMGIGDLAYDRAPVQISQFESDIRIAEHLDKIWIERGGGGNRFESYTAAWYMGLYHTRLDCWKRGKKGIIITMGDEGMNPYLPARRLAQITGDQIHEDVDTRKLYAKALEKFDIYHIAIDDREDCYHIYRDAIKHSFGKLLKDHLLISTLDMLPQTILQCLEKSMACHKQADVQQDGQQVQTVPVISWSTDPAPADGHKPEGAGKTGAGPVTTEKKQADEKRDGLFGLFNGLAALRW